MLWHVTWNGLSKHSAGNDCTAVAAAAAVIQYHLPGHSSYSYKKNDVHAEGAIYYKYIGIWKTRNISKPLKTSKLSPKDHRQDTRACIFSYILLPGSLYQPLSTGMYSYLLKAITPYTYSVVHARARHFCRYPINVLLLPSIKPSYRSGGTARMIRASRQAW